MESFRPGAIARLGLGYDALSQRKPELVYCSISGFGQDGPYRDHAAHDMNCLAAAGYFSIPSQIEGRPARPQVRMADVAAGQAAAHAVSMALWAVEKGGVGQHIDVSMFDVVAHWSTQMIIGTSTPNNPDPAEAPWVMADSDLYQTSDGRYIAIATLEDKYWQAFVDATRDIDAEVGSDVFASRRGRDANKLALHKVLTRLVRQLDFSGWRARLADAGTCWAPVLQGSELLTDPHYLSRGLISRGNKSAPDATYSLHPVQFGGVRPSVGRPAPALGEHNDTHVTDL